MNLAAAVAGCQVLYSFRLQLRSVDKWQDQLFLPYFPGGMPVMFLKVRMKLA